MKTTLTTLLTAIGVSGLLLTAAAQPADQPDNNNPAPAAPDQNQTQPAPDQTAQPDQNAAAAEAAPMEPRTITSTAIAPRGSAPQTVAPAFTPPRNAVSGNQNDLTMNFNNAPLDQVLTYLSDAAGYIVVQQIPVNGRVTIKGSHITRDQAVDLLNSELNQNNYAAIRDDTNPRILTIVSKNEAKTSRIPVLTGNDPDKIPNNDEFATWIIPIRFVEARQLVSDLSLFVSSQATVVANEAGNSIVITDTQANIRHLVKIIQAVDGSAESETEIKVFPLKYASPVDVANELSSVFPSSSGTGSMSPITFGGRGGRGGFGGGRGGFGGGRGGGNPFAALFGGGASASSDTQQRIQKATQVTAVADQRIQAVIVTAPHDLMTEIAGIMDEIDVASDRDQTVATIQLQNGDPQQVAQVLQQMFSNGNSGRGGSGSSQNSLLQTRTQSAATAMGQTTTSSLNGSTGFGGAGGGGRGGAGGF